MEKNALEISYKRQALLWEIIEYASVALLGFLTAMVFWKLVGLLHVSNKAFFLVSLISMFNGCVTIFASKAKVWNLSQIKKLRS